VALEIAGIFGFLWNMPVTYKGALEHLVSLHDVCASVTHQLAAAAAVASATAGS